jgi:hypothetical protein
MSARTPTNVALAVALQELGNDTDFTAIAERANELLAKWEVWFQRRRRDREYRAIDREIERLKDLCCLSWWERLKRRQIPRRDNDG